MEFQFTNDINATTNMLWPHSEFGKLNSNWQGHQQKSPWGDFYEKIGTLGNSGKWGL